MLYSVVSTVTKRNSDGSSKTTQVPIFYLDSNTQGITSLDHAYTIARNVVNPTKDESLDCHVHVVGH